MPLKLDDSGQLSVKIRLTNGQMKDDQCILFSHSLKFHRVPNSVFMKLNIDSATERA